MNERAWRGMIAILCVSIPIIILAQGENNASDADLPRSGWANVDLTQYCGKPIGDLIDALGHDYKSIEPVFDEISMVAFKFKYDIVWMTIYPDEIEYCRKVYLTDQKDYYDIHEICDYNDLKRERIGRIYISTSKERNVKPSCARRTDSVDSDVFILDIPNYLGMPIDSILDDIGHKPMKSKVQYTRRPLIYGEIKYVGCRFIYSNGVSLALYFDSIISQPAGSTAVIRDVNHFGNVEVGTISVNVNCNTIDSLRQSIR
ncbi:MAG: hypothetical protein ACFFEW_16320 [Candidatus Thorarchaeota archaeon]